MTVQGLASDDKHCVVFQVAAQQGKYLAKLLAGGKAVPGVSPVGQVKPFKYGHKGSLAYVGRDNAVMDVPGVRPITGFAAGALAGHPSAVCHEWTMDTAAAHCGKRWTSNCSSQLTLVDWPATRGQTPSDLV